MAAESSKSGSSSSEAEDAATSAGESATSANDTTAGNDPTKPSAESESKSHPYPPALIATAVALPVALVIGVLVAAVLANRAPVEREPLVLGPVPAPGAESPACLALLPALPADLGDYTKSTLVEPSPPATRAWQPKDGGDAIVLRCGLDRPLEYNSAAALQLVNGVQWVQATDPADTASTWFAVDRETYIALTLPKGTGPTPLQEVSDTIKANLPQHENAPGPVPN